jgi:LPXTG-motif cell wall-anchored protein
MPWMLAAGVVAILAGAVLLTGRLRRRHARDMSA